MSTATNGTSSFAGLPLHVVPNREADSYGELQKAQKLFKGLLASDSREWSLAVDAKGSKIWMRKKEGGGTLPVVKGEYIVEGVTTEQVLGTVLSQTARKECESLRFIGGSRCDLVKGESFPDLVFAWCRGSSLFVDRYYFARQLI